MLKIICLTLILIAWGVYSLQFGIDFLSTQGADVWGQFGDFTGGVLNPILSFISICLLIKSLTLQLQSNLTLRKELKRQEALEDYKKFEVRFFSLIDAQESNYGKLNIAIDTGADNDDGNHDSPVEVTAIIQYRVGNAVTYIDDNLSVLVKANISRDRITSWLEDLDVDDHFFSLIRRFYLLVKLIDDKIDSESEKEEHYELLINLTDEKLLTAIVILCEYFKWDNVVYIKDSGIIKQAKMHDYVINYLK